jgi:DNA gyrase/topoisomerase IV subunit B
MNNKIEVLDDVEHILKRPNIYIGSINKTKDLRYIYENGKFIEAEVNIVPGMIKLVEEIIDNSVESHIKNKFQDKPKIKINIYDDYFVVEDNGIGIPNIKHYNKIKKKEEYMCETAFGTAKAGSNFNDNERVGVSLNGLGSFLTNVYSLKFIAINKNNGLEIKCTWSNNSYNYKKTIKEIQKDKTGVKITSYLDFKRFKRTKFLKDDYKVIYTRLVFLALTYPEITFYFNGEKVKTPKEIIF